MKLKPHPISESDLTEYLDTQSDLAFELTVLKTLLAQGFSCEHGGTYDDPVTQMPRQFDIRAVKTVRNFRQFRIRLAVECKHLGDHFPLLILCLPRRREEAFHEIVRSSAGPIPQHKSVRKSGLNSIYKPNELVGKSAAQVGRQQNNEGTIHASDSDVYAKWAQAVSSAQDLIDLAYHDGENDSKEQISGDYSSVVFPVLVVPDGTLWRAEFDANGSKIGKPHQVERCSYFIDKFYFGGVKGLEGSRYRVSHLEFVTLTGLVTLLNDLFLSEDTF